MKDVSQLLEYRGFLGLDSRSDETLVARPYQPYTENLILKKGVLECKKGSESWGSLDHSSISGDLHEIKGFDIGATEYILLHKGTGIYYGTKWGSWIAVQDLASVDLVVEDDESEFEAMGTGVGSSGKISFKVLFKQSSGCKIIEFDGDLSIWIGRDTGIDTSGVSFSLSNGIGSNTREGTYRVRVVAQRVVGDVRVNESAPVGTISGSSLDPPSYQEITIPSGGGEINITVLDSSPDTQVTHYGVQVTQVLEMVGDTEWSNNGNDPTVFYESISFSSANLGTSQSVPADVDTLKIVTPNLTGYKAIPGHLISVVTGNLVFFTGVEGNVNRIYNAGVSGFYYHSELYNPYEFQSGGDDDGELIIALGKVQDHLLVLKEARTGIIPNRSLDSKVVWRDYHLGIKSRKAFANVSEDEIIILNQDGIFRVFNGIRYDRERSIGGETYGFSENIRTISESIDPTTIDFVYDDERMHVIYTDSGFKYALVFHPRDNYGWTRWADCRIKYPFKVNNGSEFIFEDEGLLYQQNPDGDVYSNFGSEIPWSVDFALMTSQITKRNKILVKEVAIDGEFDNDIYSNYTLDIERFVGVLKDSTPKVSDGYLIPWYQLPANYQLSGQYIKLTVTGNGKAVIRGINWNYIEKRPGSLWQLEEYEPGDFVTPLEDFDIDETGTAVIDYDETGTATTDIEEIA